MSKQDFSIQIKLQGHFQMFLQWACDKKILLFEDLNFIKSIEGGGKVVLGRMGKWGKLHWAVRVEKVLYKNQSSYHLPSSQSVCVFFQIGKEAWTLLEGSGSWWGKDPY